MDFLEVRHLKKYFQTSRGPLHAVDDVSFSIQKQKTLGVVGESGCGKSTLGRVIMGLIDPTDGQIFFDGEELTKLKKREQRAARKDMDIIFQDPYASLDPRMCVRDLIAEPMDIAGAYSTKEERLERVEELMDTVGLATRFALSFPHELDGGRRQRIGIARAIAMNPSFIVCDEPVSALDVSIQAQILNLLQDIQDQIGLTYMFITHNLAVVRHISDDILVMYLGCVVEKSETNELFSNPLHPYTRGLFSAIPIPVVRKDHKKIILSGEVSSPINPKPGCRFAPRCPFAKEDCHAVIPELREVTPGHVVACHHVEEIHADIGETRILPV